MGLGSGVTGQGAARTMKLDSKALETIFGPTSRGDTPDERARSSDRRFIKGLDQLALDEGQVANGRRLTAYEVLDAYGLDVLADCVLEGSALATDTPNAPSLVLRLRREQLGLATKHVSNRSDLPISTVVRLESSTERLPIREYEQAAQVLGLDERLISTARAVTDNEKLAVRLRTLGEENPRLTASAVAAIAEAAWVASTQVRLESWLGIRTDLQVKASPNYGTPGMPSFQWGYYLAERCRNEFNLRQNPISSLREFCEDVLGVPVIQAELNEWIAGLTVQTGTARAIVLNRGGKNENAFVRRSTLAHEVAHLLYDPEDRLQALRVDLFDELEQDAASIKDVVEQRANAFSVEFIAPKQRSLEVFKTSKEKFPIRSVMEEFGISFTAARFQVWNASQRKIPFDSIVTDQWRASTDWEAREAYATAYHPIRSLPPTRVGRFSAVVVCAAERGLITWDTAASYLRCSPEEATAAAQYVRELYPAVFVTH